MHKVVVLIITLLTIASASVNGEGLLDKLRKDLKKAAPFKAAFTQKVMDGDEVLDEASGDLIYKDPQTFKLIYTEPEYKIALFRKNSYIFYDRDSEQVTTTKNINERKDFLWRFIFNDSMKKYILVNKKKRTLKIVKEDENIDITVILDKNGMPGKVIHQSGGNPNVYFFSKYRKRVTIAEGEFDFTFPDGVEIIEM